ncbi:hypothetical protein Plim_4265 (plasmid) [Planctopirus limnophila DSM 3776]|uniref:Uncharacterized protein n=1 Tax=Planctopirus limnophila (strain ATCC 43296 / DSM 3776 / IFAM 1008 / Mu 290) TaxID=521674 RepID=D5SZF2_PLAL2|nr:hypothetical protein [Planctopirus limnophila]ADG70072.1 hypothetical protein Plim_4265 [Planctopirus limnophila DSM 3776]
MAVKVADRVLETTNTTGTGSFQLLGTQTGFVRFRDGGILTGEQVYYVAEHPTLDEWEVGVGTLTTGTPDVLARVQILSSSNAGSAVSFSPGRKRIRCTLPAEALEDYGDLLGQINSHASRHKHGGADEVATATPAANAIPKAGAGGSLADGWIPSLAISKTTGLQAALDAKAALSHNHGDADLIALDAAKLTGTIDPARLPVLPSSVQIVSSGGIADLTSPQQAEIGDGSIVTTTDGRRWVYTGSGSKTSEASYIELADLTPEWSVIANKPAILTAIDALSAAGIIARTGAGTVAARTITQGTGVTVTNGDGVSGNPTIAIGQAVATTSDVTFNTLTTTSTANVQGSMRVGSAGAVGNASYMMQVVQNAASTRNFVVENSSGTHNAGFVVIAGSRNMSFTQTPSGASGMTVTGGGDLLFNIGSADRHYMQAAGSFRDFGISSTPSGVSGWATRWADTSGNWYTRAGTGSIYRLGAQGLFAITYGATITPDANNGPVQSCTLTGAVTVAAPTNMSSGDFLNLVLIQDGTGGRAVTLSAFSLTSNSAAIDTTANKRQEIQIRRDGSIYRAHVLGSY